MIGQSSIWLGAQKESKIGTDRTAEKIYKVNRENGELISIQNQ